MEIKKLNQSLGAIVEALRDGAKVYVVGSHEEGCGYWYEVRNVGNRCKLSHESGDILLTEYNIKPWLKDCEFIAVL